MLLLDSTSNKDNIEKQSTNYTSKTKHNHLSYFIFNSFKMLFRWVVLLSVALMATAFMPSRMPRVVPRQQSLELQMNSNNMLKNLVTGALMGFTFLSSSGIARAEIDYDGIKYLGGGEKIDLNNANVRAYLELPGLYPTIAGKIVSHGPYKTVADVYSVAGLSATEKDILKKYESKFVTLDPKPEYVLDRINNGLYK